MAGGKGILFLFLFFLSNSKGLEHKIACNGTWDGTHCLQNETCVGYQENLLTLADKNYLLSVHTSLRENMTKEINGKLPKAFFMKKLSWNDELAEMAHTWAGKCRTTKEPNLHLGNQSVGQLILTVEENNGSSLRDMIDSWTSGLKHLNPKIIAKYQHPSSASQDYQAVTQMMWWSTTQVGCGRSSFKPTVCEEKGKTCGVVVELVCNYFPAGNKEGEPVYITTNDNNLICQYDDKNIHCKNMGSKKEKDKPKGKSIRDKEIFNRIRNRMLELWPAAAGASSTWETRDLNFLYILLFTTFNLCFKCKF